MTTTNKAAAYFANGNKIITAKSITEHEIGCLRREARDASDLRMAMICRLALDPDVLDGAESWWTDDERVEADLLLSEGRTQEWAIEECVRVVNDAGAAHDR